MPQNLTAGKLLRERELTKLLLSTKMLKSSNGKGGDIQCSHDEFTPDLYCNYIRAVTNLDLV